MVPGGRGTSSPKIQGLPDYTWQQLGGSSLDTPFSATDRTNNSVRRQNKNSCRKCLRRQARYLLLAIYLDLQVQVGTRGRSNEDRLA